MENRENAITGEERKVVYLCNGEVPYCSKKICYKTIGAFLAGYTCEYTSDVRYALNFQNEGTDYAYYEKKREEDQKKTEGYRLEVPRTINIDGVEIPTYQTLWEKNMKTNLRIDRCIKTLVVIVLAEVALALSILFE